MKKQIFAILMVFLVASTTMFDISSAKRKTVVIPENLELYIMAGQSNMSGRAAYPRIQPFDEMAFVLGDDYTWCIAREPIDRKCNGKISVDRVNWDDTMAKYGPELSFAVNLRSLNPSHPVGLIPCSKGATSMTNWVASKEEGTLYAACLKRAYAGTMYGTVSGLIFWQGESDAKNRELAEQWEENFTALVEGFISEFGDIPVVFAQLNTHPDNKTHPFWSIVQQEQYQASLDIPNSVMVPMEGLPLAPDNVHHSTNGYTEAGLRFAQGLCTIKECK